MVTFRNNNTRRNSFRRGDRNFKASNDRNKYNNFANNDSFQRKLSGRNNHNASKLIEKYNNLAREALSTGDKILSENYFQHADKNSEQSLSESDNKDTENFSKDKNQANDKIETKVS